MGIGWLASSGRLVRTRQLVADAVQHAPPTGSALAGTAAGPVTRVRTPRMSATDFYAGVSVLVYSRDREPPSGYGQLLDRLVDMNVNSLAIVFPLYTDDVHSVVVRRGPDTPPDMQLTALIRQARGRGFNVMLRPLLDEASLLPDWRGAIRPRDPSAWFTSYDALILSYAHLAQAEGVSSLAIGTELNSMEPNTAAWRSLIAQVRQSYSGQVTYAFNYNTTFQTAFWPDLDFVSIDAYFPLDRAPVGASSAQMAADWRRWLALIQQVDGQYHKRIVFTEAGVVPKAGAHMRPFDSGIAGAFDLDEQRAYYEATCGAVPGVVSGLYWWAVGPSLPSNLPPTDYSPLGRPAEQVVRSCYDRIESQTPTPVGLANL